MKHVAIIIALVCVLSASADAQRVIKVSRSGLGDYTSIMQAVNSASVGDIIKVWPGKYEEKIELNKDVTIEGSGAEATIISYQERDYAADVSAGVLKWFTITSQSTGCKVSGKGKVLNCIAANCSENGYHGWSGGKIINCISANNRHGYWIEANNTPIITNCVAYNNREYGFYTLEVSPYRSYLVEYCLSFGNKANYKSGWSCSTVKSTGSIEEDPKYMLSGWNVSSSSPCVDSGNSSYTDPDNSPADMGYYGGDYAPTFPVVTKALPELNSDGTIKINATGVSRY